MRMSELDIRTVLITWYDQPEDTEEEVDVVVGDGNTIFDGDYEFDERIFFYFHDEAEFQSAKEKEHPDIGFRIIEEVED